MRPRRLHHEQPETFAFTPENLKWSEGEVKKYPAGRQASAVLALLWRAQEQHGGWLPEPAVRCVAEMLEMPPIRVLEVATFYTMFNLQPVGEHQVQVCGTTPCWLRGADALKEVCRELIGKEGEVNDALSWCEVECMGGCVNAPMVQVGAQTWEDMDDARMRELVVGLRAGKPPKAGPREGRHSSEPYDEEA